MKNKADKLLAAVDLAGTYLFAVEGAIAAIHGNLDFLGMVVLAFVTAVGGGIIRDLLIGAVPPGAIRDWRYTAIAMAGAATAFFFHQLVQEIPVTLMLTLDAAGLSLFAISGAGKALDYEITSGDGCCDGRHHRSAVEARCEILLLAHVPTVLRADVYATAAFAWGCDPGNRTEAESASRGCGCGRRVGMLSVADGGCGVSLEPAEGGGIREAGRRWEIV